MHLTDTFKKMKHRTAITYCLLFWAVSLFPYRSLAQVDSSSTNWKIGLFFSPEQGFRNVPKGDTSNLNLRPTFLYTCGILFEKNITKRIAFNFGLHYSLRGHQSIDYGYGKNYDYPSTSILLEKAIYKDVYQHLGFPLHLHYTFYNRKKVSFFAAAGIDLNFLILSTSSYNRIIHGQEKEVFTNKSWINTDGYSYNFFNPSSYISIGSEFQITQKIGVRIEPSYRRSMLSLAPSPKGRYYYNFGLNVGLLFYLN
jgi:hypothetical protein